MTPLRRDRQDKVEIVPHPSTGSSQSFSPEDNPLDIIDRDHALHEQLCDSLEEIADNLPNKVDPHLCAAAAATLRAELRLHHLDEERGLFPLLAKHTEAVAGLSEIVKHLTQEHESDEGFAGELVEGLDRMAAGTPPDNPDMMGYMLRGFFEGYRRHIAWESAVVMPLARRYLDSQDLRILSQHMAENRKNYADM